MAYRDDNKNLPGRTKQQSSGGVNALAGVYTAVVTDNEDSINTGRVKVKIPQFGGEEVSRLVLLVTPFGGVSNGRENSDDPADEKGAPKSFGMWPQPPAIGTEVLVAYTTGREEGFLVGSFVGKDRNHMMGGQASAEAYNPDGTTSFGPTVEKNVHDSNDQSTKPMNVETSARLSQQGLAGDLVRGHSASSARRESPSKVFGINTAGGHVLTLDDGDAEGGSANIRLRSKNGAQILLDDSNDMIFVTNSSGSAYVEIDRAGMIDVYSETSISMHCEGSYNLHAKGNINMQADQGVNIKSAGAEGIKVEASVGSIDQYAETNININAAQSTNILSKHHVETANMIDMNGPQAMTASKVTMHSQVANKGVAESAVERVPEHQPWDGKTSLQETFNTSKGTVS